jgi:UDP-N-acetylglucosamine--N-acetylmuramyl-(pentapeptide) pyrophosphoryl-undecaprenol N-acetylglucosamine transferase
MGIPTAVLQQNATVGLTNKLLAHFVARAFVTYESTIADFPRGVALLTGNPVGQKILAAAKSKEGSAEPRKRSRFNLLVMGGSQGARAIDDWAPRAIASVSERLKLEVLHQCGSSNRSAVKELYRKAGITARVVSFIDDMASAYTWTDLVISRSGATTVSELTVMGLPAVLLPYPHHKDLQQAKNAEPMKRAGAAIVLDERSDSWKDMSAAVISFLENDADLLAARHAAANLGRPAAAQIIVDELVALSRGRK